MHHVRSPWSSARKRLTMMGLFKALGYRCIVNITLAIARLGEKWRHLFRPVRLDLLHVLRLTDDIDRLLAI